MTKDNFYFQILPRAAKQEDIIKFLKNVLRNTDEKLLVIWDRIQIHRSKKVRAFIEETEGKIKVKYLPAYAPELNPVEYLWGKWKKYAVPNFCPRTFEELKSTARKTLYNMKRRNDPVSAFWRQAKLSP